MNQRRILVTYHSEEWGRLADRGWFTWVVEEVEYRGLVVLIAEMRPRQQSRYAFGVYT